MPSGIYKSAKRGRPKGIASPYKGTGRKGERARVSAWCAAHEASMRPSATALRIVEQRSRNDYEHVDAIEM